MKGNDFLRYQDYVIKDGKFIGKFEEMYQEHENPWHQIELTETLYSKAVTVNTIKRFKLRNILEIGCGLGCFTNRLSRECPEAVITGMDISETAIAKAKIKWPNLPFFVGNLQDIDSILETREKHEPIDGILFSEILWYVLDNLDDIKWKIKK